MHRLCALVFLMTLITMVLSNAGVQAAEFHVTTAAELETALSTAQANGKADTVYLAGGTYTCDPTWGFRYNSINGDEDITLTAEDGLESTEVVLTGANKNALPVLTVADQAKKSNITLKGITIQKGVTFAAVELVSYGGDITVDNCVIQDNSDNYSGLVVATSVLDEGIPSGGDIQFSNNSVMNNTGNVNLNGRSVQVTANLISGNTGDGGLFIKAGTVILTNNVVTGNTGGKGGGASITTAEDGKIVLTNNTIVENDATSTGGGVHAILYSGECIYFYNNIIRGNTAVNAGDDIDLMLFGGRAEGYNNNYTEIKGDWDAEDGNRDLDSGFVNAADQDWHLSDNSVLIDAGVNTAMNLPDTDKDGSTRIIDGNEDGTDMVDIGAYEYVPPLSRVENANDKDDSCFISTATGCWTKPLRGER